MFIEIDDSIVNVYSIVRLYELIPNQVWVSLSNGDTFLAPNFHDKKSLMSYIINEIELVQEELEKVRAEAKQKTADELKKILEEGHSHL